MNILYIKIKMIKFGVKDLKPSLIIAEVLTGCAEGVTVFIPRIDLAPTNTELPFTLTRRQFPIKLAFAMTINKSQGQTLEKVGIYLPTPVFSHGQLYVAFSRGRSSNDVIVKVIDGPEQGKLIDGSEKVFTKNVVFKHIFSMLRIGVRASGGLRNVPSVPSKEGPCGYTRKGAHVPCPG